MTDRSLDDFLSDSGDSESDTDGSESESTDDEPEAGESVATAEIDPAVATATASPDGAACEACGETVTRRWHDDGRYVCPDCKDW